MVDPEHGPAPKGATDYAQLRVDAEQLGATDLRLSSSLPTAEEALFNRALGYPLEPIVKPASEAGGDRSGAFGKGPTSASSAGGESDTPSLAESVSNRGGNVPPLGPPARPVSGGPNGGRDDDRTETERIQDQYENAVRYARSDNQERFSVLRECVRRVPGEKIDVRFYKTMSGPDYGFERDVLESVSSDIRGAGWVFSNISAHYSLINDLVNGQYTESELRGLGLHDIFSPEALTLIQNDFFNKLAERLEEIYLSWRLSAAPGFYLDSPIKIEREDQIPPAYTDWLNAWKDNPRLVSWRSDGRWRFTSIQGPEFTSWLQAQTQRIAPEHNIFMPDNVPASAASVGALEVRAIEPESGSVEKKVDGRIIVAETPEEIELETAMAANLDYLIRGRIPLENFLGRVSSIETTDPEGRDAALLEVFKEELGKNYFTGNITNLEFSLQRDLRSLMYSPRQVNQILDILGFSPEQRARLEDGVYGGKQYDMDQHSKFPFTDPIWGLERKIWESDQGYKAWVSAKEEAERRRIPFAIERAFENGTLSTDPERLIRFFDGIAQSTEVIGQLSGSERTVLGNRILGEVYTSLNGDLARARRLAGLVFSLGLESSFDDETREILADTSGLVIEGTIPQPIPSEESALQTIRGAFNNGSLDIENQDRVIQFFDGIAQATETIRTLPPEARTVLGDQILSEVNTSLDGDIPRAKRLANVVYMLGLEGNFDEETQEILEDTASL